MNVKRRTSLVASLVCGALLIASATVGAATITGTAGNDTLKGGAKADKLTGKGGNDDQRLKPHPPSHVGA